MTTLALLAQVVADTARDDPWQIKFDAVWITGLIAPVLPLLVAFITKLNASSLLKAVLHIILSAIAALVVQASVNDGVAVLSKQGLVLAIGTWAVGVVSHESLWKKNAAPHLAPEAGLG